MPATIVGVGMVIAVLFSFQMLVDIPAFLVLLRCGSVPTLPLRAHRNCCDGPTKLNTAHKAEVGNGPAPPATSPH